MDSKEAIIESLEALHDMICTLASVVSVTGVMSEQDASLFMREVKKYHRSIRQARATLEGGEVNEMDTSKREIACR